VALGAPEPAIEQTFPSQRLSDLARPRAEQADGLPTQRGVVAVAALHRDREQRGLPLALEPEGGIHGVRRREPRARTGQPRALEPVAHGSLGPTQGVKQPVQPGVVGRLAEDVHDQAAERRRGVHPARGEPVFQFVRETGRVGEDRLERLTGGGILPQHRADVIRRREPSRLGPIDADAVAYSERERGSRETRSQPRGRRRDGGPRVVIAQLDHEDRSEREIRHLGRIEAGHLVEARVRRRQFE
jgi:hypothetical protein